MNVSFPTRTVLGAGVGLALLMSGAPAFAQGVDELGAYGGLEKRQYTPQVGAVEIRVGPYKPKIDDEFGGATPYADTFGTGTRWMLGVEVDWQALRIPMFGTLGPGFGFGYTRSKGKARVASTGAESAQDTTLTIWPMYAVGVLRVDVFAREWHIPLVPYGKAGLGYALWSSSSGGDTATDDTGVSGRGASYGWQWALGGMLLLDNFDESSAVEMESSNGIDNSYFFIEYYSSQLDGFGSNKMRVGTNTVFFGIAMEF